jgi:hypothetical protein
VCSGTPRYFASADAVFTPFDRVVDVRIVLGLVAVPFENVLREFSLCPVDVFSSAMSSKKLLGAKLVERSDLAAAGLFFTDRLIAQRLVA